MPRHVAHLYGQVPVLNRASFDVRLVACVWLVAPGPQDQSTSNSEDRESQPDLWERAEEDSGVASPSHSCRSSGSGRVSNMSKGLRYTEGNKVLPPVELMPPPPAPPLLWIEVAPALE